MVTMKTQDFYYDLPQELIAQTPLNRRDASRLLVLDKASGAIQHRHFFEVGEYLRPGDLLVLNDSRVLPSRLLGQKEGTGSAMEFLLLRQLEQDVWETMVRPGKKAKVGSTFVFGEGLLYGEVLDTLEGGTRRVRFRHRGQNFFEVLEQVGNMPLPPYITHSLRDRERYQTVYSRELGSAAAPTAGLHFTRELLAQLEEQGIQVATVTLHVGLGTFRPVKAEDITDHHMHQEYYSIPERTADLVNQTKANGGRVIGVGTTSCRTLESAYQGSLAPCTHASTEIFIYPGYQFKVLDGLITNFHLPESTLIMLVSALAGREQILGAYQEAIRERYRFFSFGDAMLIV